MNEFTIINQYFKQHPSNRPDVINGIGDDAAIVKPPLNMDLAISTDTLISGVHFPETTNPYDVGYKSLAVNLSDLAAMGADPAWVTLSLTLPEINPDWLQHFTYGFFALINQFKLQLIGGDLTRGPLSVTVQVIGFVPNNKALLRSKAKPSDLVYVTGTLGDAGLALLTFQKKMQLKQANLAFLMNRLQRPEPRLRCGQILRDYASSAIDISDGLVADLNHILEESHVGAMINVDKLPMSAAVSNSIPINEATSLALTAGDDYELCFTIPPHQRAEMENKLSALACQFTCIGEIIEQQELILQYQDGTKYTGPQKGYEHFK